MTGDDVADQSESRRIAHAIWTAIGIAALVTLTGLVAFWPDGGAEQVSDPDLVSEPPLKRRSSM